MEQEESSIDLSLNIGPEDVRKIVIAQLTTRVNNILKSKFPTSRIEQIIESVIKSQAHSIVYNKVEGLDLEKNIGKYIDKDSLIDIISTNVVDKIVYGLELSDEEDE